MNNTATVEVKSAWYSKINWTQAAGIIAMVLSYFGLDLDPEAQAAVLAAITGIMGVVTWALRTFATKTVTPSSVGK